MNELNIVDPQHLVQDKKTKKDWLLIDFPVENDAFAKAKKVRYIYAPEHAVVLKHTIIPADYGYGGRQSEEFEIIFSVPFSADRIDIKQMIIDYINDDDTRRNPMFKGDWVSDSARVAKIEEVVHANNVGVIVEDAKWFPNYGHYLDYINEADGMAWDIYAPGFDYPLTPGEYKIKGVHSILELTNGNHKICVIIDKPDYDPSLANKQIIEFKEFYENLNDMKMRVMVPANY